MNISELIKTATEETREESKICITNYLGRKIVIKKSRNTTDQINEIDIVSFLYNANIPTYKIINDEFNDSNGYIVYEYIEGRDGFALNRDSRYFFDVGSRIGEMQNALEKYSDRLSMKSIIHADLHSGNIIDNNNIKYIIDFSSTRFGEWFIDLLNIEYEILYENDSDEKEKAFIDGYQMKRKIKYPNRRSVISEIIRNDEDEYKRLITRGNNDSDYFLNLRYHVINKKPTFIPKWCL